MYQRQEIFNIIELFTSTKLKDFYSNIFKNLDLSSIPDKLPSKYGPKGFSRHALIRAFVIMKCEKMSFISDLVKFLNNNLILAYLCGFDIQKSLPSYSVFQRFICNLDNSSLKKIMQRSVKALEKLGFIDSSFISLDSTPIKANTKNNNPKSFLKKKFKKDEPPKSDKDCKLGVHTANNSYNNKKYEFYWGYKNFVLCDPISGLPISELTTTADIADISMAISILKETNSWFPLRNTYFIADKGFDSSANYDYVKNVLHGLAFIARNKRSSKPNRKALKSGNLICKAGLAMYKDGRQYLKNSIKQKFCCPFKNSKDDSLCPCNNPKYFNGKKNRGCVKYHSQSTDYRGSINTNSKFFKSIYALRTESERYNSRFKNLNLEQAYVRTKKAVTNLNTLGHICLLLVAITAVKLNSVDNIRSLSNLKKSA